MRHMVLSAVAGLTLLISTAHANETLSVEPYTFTARDGTTVEAERGTIEVPVNRDNPSSGTTTLSFVRFPATTETPGAPIVYLAGGPGGSGSGTAQGPRFPLFMALREVADVIAFDQRGTGMSDRIPSCVDNNPPSLDQPLTREAFAQYYRDEVARCWQVWIEQGIDIAAYNTWESAADIDDLRIALGAEQVNLWGISYGSHLGFAYLKRYPANVERAVFAGAEGLSQTVKLPSRTDAYFERVQERIEANPEALAVYGDFPELMRRVHERLNEDPAVVTFTPEGEDEPVTLTFSAFPIQLLAGYSIADPQGVARLPLFYYALDNGQYERAATVLYANLFSGQAEMRGMSTAMDLASGISPERLARVERERQTSLLDDALNFPMPQIAGVVPEADLGEAFRAPLQSDVPMLFLSGDLDGRTYLESHAEILAHLPNATQVIVHNGGHNIFEADERVQDIVVRYLEGEDVSDAQIELEMPPILVP